MGTWDNDQPIVPLGVVFAAFVTAVEWLTAVRAVTAVDSTQDHGIDHTNEPSQGFRYLK